MRQLIFAAICLIIAVPALGGALMSVDDRALVDRISQADRDDGGGKNHLAKDSGTLAWSEASALEMFYRMYRVTQDTHWLDRLVSHADVILDNSRKDSRGHVGWFTAAYSTAVAEVSADPANHGTAELTPPSRVLSDAKLASKVAGHTYSVVARDDENLAIRDETAKTDTGTVPKGESKVPISEFAFELKGSPRAGDRFTVKTTPPEPTDYLVHDGMILRPIAAFVEVVKDDPKLKAKYGANAKRYLEFIEKSIVPKWDSRWREFDGGGGAYIATDLKTHRFPNVVLPHNQYLAFGRVLFPLYRVTGKKAYLDRARKMARLFKSKLTLVDGGYVWNYWDSARAEDAPGRDMCFGEDTSHGAIDVAFAVDAFEAGCVFTREDLDRMANTYAGHIWNQSVEKPLYCKHVDRRLDPEGKADCVAVYGWQMLARYCPEVEKAIEPTYRQGYAWGPVASEWLYARYVKKQGDSNGKQADTLR